MKLLIAQSLYNLAAFLYNQQLGEEVELTAEKLPDPDELALAEALAKAQAGQLIAGALDTTALAADIAARLAAGDLCVSLKDGQYVNLNPGQVVNLGPGQAVRLEPKQKVDLNPGQSVDLNPNQVVNLNPGQTVRLEPKQKVDLNPGQSVDLNPDQAVNLNPGQIVSLDSAQRVDLNPNQKVDLNPGQKVGLEPGQEVGLTSAYTNKLTAEYKQALDELKKQNAVLFNDTASQYLNACERINQLCVTNAKEWLLRVSEIAAQDAQISVKWADLNEVLRTMENASAALSKGYETHVKYIEEMTTVYSAHTLFAELADKVAKIAAVQDSLSELYTKISANVGASTAAAIASAAQDATSTMINIKQLSKREEGSKW